MSVSCLSSNTSIAEAIVDGGVPPSGMASVSYQEQVGKFNIS